MTDCSREQRVHDAMLATGAARTFISLPGHRSGPTWQGGVDIASAWYTSAEPGAKRLVWSIYELPPERPEDHTFMPRGPSGETWFVVGEDDVMFHDETTALEVWLTREKDE